MAPSRAIGSVGSQPSSSVSPQPKKPPSPILGSGAPASDKTGAIAPLSHACEVETGLHLDAMAHSGLACVYSFGSGLGKAQVLATLGVPFKPFDPTPPNNLGQENPRCSPCRRRGTPALSPATAGTPQLEASPPVFEPSPLAEACNPQGRTP